MLLMYQNQVNSTTTMLYNIANVLQTEAYDQARNNVQGVCFEIYRFVKKNYVFDAFCSVGRDIIKRNLISNHFCTYTFLIFS